MFTGIIEKTLRILAKAESPGVVRLTLATDWTDVSPGESIAINGCCLTVAKIAPGELGFDVIAETLSRTNLGLLAPGDWVNVERSLRIGDRLSGHFVQGHIDGVVRLTDIKATADERRLTLAPPTDLAKYIVPKGSVSLDGVSLTIAAVHEKTFEVALIPTTLNLTTLGQKKLGWLFNLETDVLSKTVISYLENRR